MKTLLLLFAATLYRSSTCFYTSFSSLDSRLSPHTTFDAKIWAARDNIAQEIDWNEDIRNEAAYALLPVLFPRFNGSAALKPISAEAALKKVLRSKNFTTHTGRQTDCRVLFKRNQGPPFKSGMENTTTSTGNGSRGLAALILGTSVMRLRHWYVVATSHLYHDKSPPIPHPLSESILSLLPDYSAGRSRPKSNNNCCNWSDDEIYTFVKTMVDEHLNYLSRAESPFDKSSNQLSPASKLSLKYSTPIFITEALLRHHGYSTTEQILACSNAPGPVTARKNSIRFPGSDKELCQWLIDEDGVHAVPLANITEDKLTMCRASNDNNRFTIIGSDMKPGTVKAPTGCIQILESESSTAPSGHTNNTSKKLSKSIWSMKGWQLGYFEVQDAGSQVIVSSLETKPGDSVLDYCSGNGGKTFGMASVLMQSKPDKSTEDLVAKCTSNDLTFISEIVAHDVIDERLRQIKGSMLRVGFVEELNPSKIPGCFSFYTERTDQRDNSNITLGCRIHVTTPAGLQAMADKSKFDVVLVDAPCSSSGVLRRRPSQRWILTENEVFNSLPELQLEILAKAAGFVKSGCKLVYSTCSLLKEENEDVVSAFEHSHIFGRFQKWSFDTRENTIGYNTSHDNTLTILPSAMSDGFFIARWKAVK